MMQGKILTKKINEPISDRFKLIAVNQKSKTVLERIAESDKTAIGECLSIYGNYVWTLAKKFCQDSLNREKCVEEIFQDIWKNAGSFDAEKIDEKEFIAILSLKRLLNKT
ncbi:MAG TPA: hypothetical protein PKY59_18405, partial [Pyrinomonadaceae bacterium]|nr:hypothetical protein [Pyrinomonadaceae bacterium]